VLIVFAMTLATTAVAVQVQHLTFSSGSGYATTTPGGAHVTLGQGLAGGAKHVAGNYMAGLGIWEILAETYFVSPVALEMPGLSDRLFANYPNPFNPSTRIRYSLAEDSDVRIEIYDLRGRNVDTLVHGAQSAGVHTIIYEPRQLASGVYLVLMRAGSFRSTQRMMLVK